jgi:choline dehydrogenase
VYNGVRSNASFFVEGKSNITLLANTVSKQIIFDQDQNATGVRVVGPDHNEYTFSAKREIIVSQGAIGSPQLLMLSGVGRKSDLEALGIDSVIDSPHVGQNLQDHPVMTQVFKIKDGYGLDAHIRHSGPEHEAALQQYAKDKTGPFSSALLELVAFPRIDERLMKYEVYREAKAKNGGRDPFGPEGQPHFEIDFLPMFADAFQYHFPPPATGDYMTVIVDLLRPYSKPGFVKLLSTDPAKNPYINLNFLADDLDIICIREGVRYINDILMNGEGMKDLIEGDYPFPMPRTLDEALDKQILERSQTGYHPCGSNRIGKDINHGVVDGELKVYGAKNLRVSDASIFPLIPDCRIQNDVYMVGEKCADMIKASHADLYGSQ